MNRILRLRIWDAASIEDYLQMVDFLKAQRDKHTHDPGVRLGPCKPETAEKVALALVKSRSSASNFNRKRGRFAI